MIPPTKTINAMIADTTRPRLCSPATAPSAKGPTTAKTVSTPVNVISIRLKDSTIGKSASVLVICCDIRVSTAPSPATTSSMIPILLSDISLVLPNLEIIARLTENANISSDNAVALGMSASTFAHCDMAISTPPNSAAITASSAIAPIDVFLLTVPAMYSIRANTAITLVSAFTAF